MQSQGSQFTVLETKECEDNVEKELQLEEDLDSILKGDVDKRGIEAASRRKGKSKCNEGLGAVTDDPILAASNDSLLEVSGRSVLKRRNGPFLF